MTGVFVTVGVAVDRVLQALVPRVLPEPPVQVAAQRAGVQFNPSAGFRAGVNDGGSIDFVGYAFRQQASGEVAEAFPVFDRSSPGRS